MVTDVGAGLAAKHPTGLPMYIRITRTSTSVPTAGRPGRAEEAISRSLKQPGAPGDPIGWGMDRLVPNSRPGASARAAFPMS